MQWVIQCGLNSHQLPEINMFIRKGLKRTERIGVL